MILEQEDILENGETILLEVRKHWVIYAYDFLVHLIGGAFFLFLARVLEKKEILGGIFDVEAKLGAAVLAGFALIVWTSFFYVWTKNYFDVWYITDRHLIAVNQKQLFDREEAFAPFSRIQDISFEKRGIIGTFFGYGNIKVQTAGTENEFSMERAASVDAIARKIIELRDDARNEPVVLG